MDLVKLLEKACDQRAGNVAFVQGERSVSYAELWTGVKSCAQALHTHGVLQGERVALLIENSAEYAMGYYGVLRAGAIVVSLNTALQPTELARVLGHCKAKILITAGQPLMLDGLLQLCPDIRVMRLEQDITNALTLSSDAYVATELDEQRPAAIVYTSGTTGEPKGVTLSHRNLVANTQAILAYLHLTASDRIVNVLPFYYAYGNSVLHTHLAVGACIVLAESLSYPHLVVQALVDQRATGLAGVPSTYALLLSRVKLSAYDLSSLRYLTQAGGAMTPELTRRLMAALPGAQLFVMYGQTEATARISYLPPARLVDKLGTVGIALSGVEIAIRDECDTPVAPGTAGEVCVRGDNVMLGYWNDSDATAIVLRDGWLHTGDAGYVDDEGYLTLVGRNSEFIKIGAHRVSPVEIEHVMMAHGGIDECAVVAMPDGILGNLIKAYVVPAEGVTLEARRLQAHCREHLATYKVPKQVELVAQLPKTASGKVRKFLLK